MTGLVADMIATYTLPHLSFVDGIQRVDGVAYVELDTLYHMCENYQETTAVCEAKYKFVLFLRRRMYSCIGD